MVSFFFEEVDFLEGAGAEEEEGAVEVVVLGAAPDVEAFFFLLLARGGGTAVVSSLGIRLGRLFLDRSDARSTES